MSLRYLRNFAILHAFVALLCFVSIVAQIFWEPRLDITAAVGTAVWGILNAFLCFDKISTIRRRKSQERKNSGKEQICCCHAARESHSRIVKSEQ